MKIGLVYGSTTGNTEDIAEAIRERLDEHVEEVINVDGLDLDELTWFDVLLVGVPTWDIGQLQESWENEIGQLDNLNFEGKRVGFFGDGDQFGYPDNFQDALGILRDRFVARGATADFGHWPADDYDFTESKGLVDGKFVGLAIDELQQPEKTEERIDAWVEQIVGELGL